MPMFGASVYALNTVCRLADDPFEQKFCPEGDILRSDFLTPGSVYDRDDG